MIDRKSIPITRIKKKLFVDKEMTKKNLSHVKKKPAIFLRKTSKHCIVDLFKKPYKIPKIVFSFLDYSSSIIALKKSNFYPK